MRVGESEILFACMRYEVRVSAESGVIRGFFRGCCYSESNVLLISKSDESELINRMSR